MMSTTSIRSPALRNLRRWHSALTGLYPIIGLAIVWEILARYSGISNALLPRFTQTAGQFGSLVQNGKLIAGLGTTVEQGAIGLAIALVAGTLIGLSMASVRVLRWFFEPVIAVGLPTPTILLLPAFLIWFGIGNWSKIVLVGVTCFFPVALSAYSGARAVDSKLIWSAQAMGTTGRGLLRRVVFPASLTYIFAGARVAVPLAVIMTVLSEMIAGGGGLGYQLTYAYNFFEGPTEYATLIAILIFGYVIDRLLLFGLRHFAPWSDSEMSA